MKRLASFLAAIFLCLSAAAQQYGVVNISVCNMRRTADFDAEMVSQALLGTPVHVLELAEKNNWRHIQTPDTYTGWVHYEGITLLSKEEYSAWNAAPKVVVTSLMGTVYDRASKKGATISDVVGGDRLRLLGKKGSFWQVGFPDGRTGYLPKADGQELNAWRRGLDNSPKAILETAKSMLGFPYIWAGMSPKGTDCSGFVRTVLFMHDIIAPRDSGPQSRVGVRIDRKDQLKPGDLVFFGRWDGDTPKVSHVGFYLGEGRFIHSLGMVKIGSLDPSAPDYDAFNAGRYLFGTNFLPFIDMHEGLNTTLTNPCYAE